MKVCLEKMSKYYKKVSSFPKWDLTYNVILNKQWEPDWQAWCSQNIGEQFVVWKCHGNGYKNCYVFRFINKEDAIWFKLKWI